MRTLRLFSAPAVRRLAAGVGANFLGKVWVALAQLLSIPVLSQHWGAHGLGVWLMLSTVPTYVALTAGGFGMAAATEMTHLVAARENIKALEVFQSIWVFISAVTAAVCGFSWVLLYGVAAFYAEFPSEPGLVHASSFLIAYSFLAIQTSTIQSAYRCTGRYAVGTLGLDAMTFIEALAVLVVAISNHGLAEAAGAMLILRVGGLAIFYVWIGARERWIKVGVRHAKIEVVRRLLHPALATLTLTGANALALQGVVVGLGLASGPAVAASFAAARSLCRMPLQASDIFGRASVPEMTRAMAIDDRALFTRLTLLNIGTALAILIPSGLFMGLWGGGLGIWMSDGALVFAPMLFPLLSLSVVFQGVWISAGQSLVAINRHHVFSYVYLSLAIVLASSPWLLRRGENMISGVAAAAVATDAIMVLFVLWMVTGRSDSQLRRNAPAPPPSYIEHRRE